jgi:hypothetical protein
MIQQIDERYEEEHIQQLQQALAEGLQAINRARTVQEADAARRKARAQLQAIGRRQRSGA